MVGLQGAERGKGRRCATIESQLIVVCVQSLVAAADGQRIADRFHRPKKPAFSDFTQTMMWRLVTREEFTDVFGKEVRSLTYYTV
jgi:hypothetical protein